MSRAFVDLLREGMSPPSEEGEPLEVELIPGTRVMVEWPTSQDEVRTRPAAIEEVHLFMDPSSNWLKVRFQDSGSLAPVSFAQIVGTG